MVLGCNAVNSHDLSLVFPSELTFIVAQYTARPMSSIKSNLMLLPTKIFALGHSGLLVLVPRHRCLEKKPPVKTSKERRLRKQIQRESENNYSISLAGYGLVELTGRVHLNLQRLLIGGWVIVN